MRGFASAVLVVAAMVLPGASLAADIFPQKPIQLIVPFAAGGPTDIIARVMGDAMSSRLGQPVTIINRAGAGGVTGVNVALKSAPDGYTIVLASAGTLSISPNLEKLPYDVAKDVAPVSLVARMPEMLVIPGAMPAASVTDLVALARAKPGKMNFGSSGIGGMPHLNGELLKSTTSIDITHIPYSGSAPALNDLIPARIDMMFSDIPVILPQLLAGTIRALAVSSSTRTPLFPQVPTMMELGLSGQSTDNWYGFVAPRATPADVLALLSNAAMQAARDPVVQKTLTEQGVILAGSSPTEFADFIGTESLKWGKIIREAHIVLQ